MTGTPIRTGISLLLMLATSACASGQVMAGAAAGTRQVDGQAALPGLPAALGSAADGASPGPLPVAARQILQALGCTAAMQDEVLVVQWPGSGGGQDMLVTDREGPHYRYWLRAFGTGDMRTGYLVQLNGCPATSHGMRCLHRDRQWGPGRGHRTVAGPGHWPGCGRNGQAAGCRRKRAVCPAGSPSGGAGTALDRRA